MWSPEFIELFTKRSEFCCMLVISLILKKNIKYSNHLLSLASSSKGLVLMIGTFLAYRSEYFQVVSTWS